MSSVEEETDFVEELNYTEGEIKSGDIVLEDDLDTAQNEDEINEATFSRSFRHQKLDLSADLMLETMRLSESPEKKSFAGIDIDQPIADSAVSGGHSTEHLNSEICDAERLVNEFNEFQSPLPRKFLNDRSEEALEEDCDYSDMHADNVDYEHEVLSKNYAVINEQFEEHEQQSDDITGCQLANKPENDKLHMPTNFDRNNANEFINISSDLMDTDADGHQEVPEMETNGHKSDNFEHTYDHSGTTTPKHLDISAEENGNNLENVSPKKTITSPKQEGGKISTKVEEFNKKQLMMNSPNQSPRAIIEDNEMPAKGKVSSLKSLFENNAVRNNDCCKDPNYKQGYGVGRSAGAVKKGAFN